MRNRLDSARKPGRWMCVGLCALMIAPLAGCNNAGLIGFAAMNGLYQSAIGYAPLRSIFGTVIRDIMVAIF